MTLHQPAYRLTVYVASLVDTDSTVLTPIGGSAHSDDFKVTTLPALAGYKPYLHAVTGRHGELDPLDMNVSTGQMKVTLMDARVGGSNLQRWVTAFTGDAEGVNTLLRCKAYVEESLDGGATWAAFFVGRIDEVQLDGPLLVTLTLRDFAADLEDDCFVGRAHSSISYAVEPLLVPLGLSAAYGGLSPAATMTGSIATGTFNGYRRIVLSEADQSRGDNLLTQALMVRSMSTLMRTDLTNQKSRLGYVRTFDGVRLRFSCASPSITQKEVRVVSILPKAATVAGYQRWRIAELVVDMVPAADPYYQAFDAGTIGDGTALTAITVRAIQQPRVGPRVAPVGSMWPGARRVEGAARTALGDPVSGDAPLYLGGVNPAQLMRDLLDGKFGELTAAGAVRKAHAYTTSSFTALTSPATDVNALPRSNWRVEKRYRLRDFLQIIGRQFHLGYRLKPQHNSGNPVSAVELVDMRTPNAATLGTVPTVTDADLDTATAVAWDHGAADARTALAVTVYLEDVLTAEERDALFGTTPSVTTSLLKQYPIEVIPAEGIGRLELGTKFHEVDAIGIRQVMANRTEDNIDATPWLELQVARVAEQYRQMFGAAPLYLSFTTRRTANTTGLWPGDWCVLDSDVVIDPATRVRGGARLVQVLEREEDGPRIAFRAIDAGPNAACAAPTVGSAPATGSPATNTATLSVTLNAASDPVVVEVNVTATSVGTQPAHNAVGWVFGARLTATGTATVRNLPSGMRIWFRARSEPANTKKTKALPSPWVVPGTTGYVDLTGLSAPTSVTITPGSITTTSTIVASWTNADSELPLQAILTTGGVDTVMARLSAATTQLTLNSYVTANTTYTFSVRYIDTLGGLGTKGTSSSFSVPSGFVGPTLTAPTLTVVLG